MNFLSLWKVLLLVSSVSAAVIHKDQHHVKYTTLDHHNQTDANHTEHTSHGNHTEHHSHGIHLASFRYSYVAQPLIITIVLLFTGISKLAFHKADFISNRVPESCLLIILGIIVGAILRLSIHDINLMPRMSSTLFFLYLLPPIILEAAWSLHDRTFFDNVGTVLIYAVIGTVLNCFLIGPTLYGLGAIGAMGSVKIHLIECLVFSAIIVAVDPVAVLAIFQEIGVNNVLYFLVFGESLLNDAVTVVLYNMMITFSEMSTIPAEQIVLGFIQFFVVSFGGIGIGIFFGVLTAIITKFTEHVRVIEPLSVFVLAYMSYLIAELFHFSGIISIIACGLTQAQYAFHNISQKSHTTVKYFSKMQSAMSDCVIFVFLGIALFGDGMFKSKNWHIGFIIWTLVLCLFFRFFVVFLLTWFVNRSNRVRRIGKEEQFIMAYGGLRGAVAFSLLDTLDGGSDLPKPMFMTTLMVLIFFTVFVQGISIKPLVKFLRVKLESKDKVTIGEEINMHVTDHVMAGIEEVLGRRGEHHYREILEFYNSKYIKNWLQKNPITTDEHIMSLYEKIALQQHFEGLAGSKMVQDKYVSDDNLPLIPEAVRNQIIEEETEPEDEDEGSDEDTVLPPITIPTPGYTTPPAPSPVPLGYRDMGPPSPLPSPSGIVHPDMIDDWLDRKIAEQREEERKSTEKTGRRKSLFPQFKKKETPKSTEPTAKDIRKLMAPTRRDVTYRKLDKNLKNDSSADLLKFLQEKQLRTRRMSRAVLGSGISTPISSVQNVNYNPRKGSVVAANNYRRRLSLAVPERPKFQRDRSPSDFTGVKPDHNLFRGVGDASKNGEPSPRTSPKRKRRPFKKAVTLNFEPEITPLINQKSPSRRPDKFDAIQEHDGEEEEGDLDTSRSSASSDTASKKKRLKFRSSKSASFEDKNDHSAVRRSDTDPTSEEKSSPKVKFDIKVPPKSGKKKLMNKAKSLDHSFSSGEHTDETSPVSIHDSRGSFKSDSGGSSSTQSGLDRTPEKSKTRPKSYTEGLQPDHEDHTRKQSYTEAMSHMIPDDPNSVELKEINKKDKKITRQKSL